MTFSTCSPPLPQKEQAISGAFFTHLPYGLPSSSSWESGGTILTLRGIAGDFDILGLLGFRHGVRS